MGVAEVVDHNVQCGEEGVHIEHKSSVPFPWGSGSKPTLGCGHLPLKLRGIPPTKRLREKSMPTTSHLPDQPIMKYVHPADRLRPWFGAAVGVAALVVMLAFGILGRNFGTLEHLKALNDAGSWLTVSLIEASAGILALLLAAVALGERIERGVEGPHFISLIRLTARGGFATIAPAVFFDVLKVTTTSVVQEGWMISALVVVQIALLAATIGAFAFMLSSLWATLRVTFVGVPESAPEETQSEESAEVRS